MKRAEVFRDRWRRVTPEWTVAVHHGDIPFRREPIWEREDSFAQRSTHFPTYAEALAHALHEVGLTQKEK